MDRKHKIMWFAILVVFLILGAGYLYLTYPRILKQGNFQLGASRLAVEIADEFGEQYQGLSDRESMCENCGMLFPYGSPKIQYFVMRRMKFPLDFVFIREGKVVQLVENVPGPKAGEIPQNIISTVPADVVLEVNAGFISKNSIKIGDLASVDPAK